MTRRRGIPPGARVVPNRRPGSTTDRGEPLIIELPQPPSDNDYYALNWKTHKYYISRHGWAFRRRVEVLVAWERQFGRERLAVLVECHTRRKSSDVPNFHKALLDALEFAQVFENDNQIDDIRIRRLHTVAGGMVKVTIWELQQCLN